eukprot:5955695-Pleurochrysis_carterae.AAC.1
MRHRHWHASRASSQGVHACQTTLTRSSQPTTVAKKNEKTEPTHQTCMRGLKAPQVVHAFCDRLLGFARAPQVTVQPSRVVTLLLRGPGSESV